MLRLEHGVSVQLLLVATHPLVHLLTRRGAVTIRLQLRLIHHWQGSEVSIQGAWLRLLHDINRVALSWMKNALGARVRAAGGVRQRVIANQDGDRVAFHRARGG